MDPENHWIVEVNVTVCVCLQGKRAALKTFLRNMSNVRSVLVRGGQPLQFPFLKRVWQGSVIIVSSGVHFISSHFSFCFHSAFIPL